jgi:hypothetical protein
MNPIGESRLTRRDAFAAAARYAAAGGIALLSAGLVAKGYLVPEAQQCRVAAACRGCRAAADCRLPAAVQFRTNEEARHSCLSQEARHSCLSQEDRHSCLSED